MNVKELVAQMTLEEKASLLSGADFWHTKPVERLDIPSVMMSDGPHGLRKQPDQADHLGVNDSIKAVCFPAGCATAASFDRELIEELGAAIGDECQAENLGVILGPAANIKRSPLCGRNFEYFSEDPYLASEIAAGHIKGVQSKNIGTSLKHFLANNQEHRRMSSSSDIDERTLREIYLAAFEGAVKNAKPWTVMCSYNRINGTFASENKTYLTDILRDEWGFDGYVVSDWGAVSDRVKGVFAGMDLEMPSSGGIRDRQIIEAVNNGTLDEKAVDAAAEHILDVNYRYLENRRPETEWDMEAHHKLAQKIASECMVLLKNEAHILPLSKSSPIAFIGAFAENPRYQGGGSSHINSFKVTSALDATKDWENITYAKGYLTEEDKTEERLLLEAIETAKAAEAAVIFAGLPDSFESEGYDRSHMRLPDCQNTLIEKVAKVNPNVVVVLHNGSPVEMPWIDDVKGVLEVYLGGQAVGAATVEILFGSRCPCGKLPETFPIHLEDNPSWLFYGGEGDHAEYREGIFVGYRYYEKKQQKVLFPFGHGLSYTSFALSNLTVSADVIQDTESLTVTADITNTGSREGKEVVQLYVADHESTVIRPVKELKGFEKVLLAPGETKTVSFALDKRSFAYWNTELHDWHVESGEFDICIGTSSADIACKKTVTVTSTQPLSVHYTLDSIFGDIMKDPKAMAVMAPLLQKMQEAFTPAPDAKNDKASVAIDDAMAAAMIKYMPVRNLLSFGGGSISLEMLNELLCKMNE